MNTLTIYPDGEVVLEDAPDTGDATQLAWLQERVGGYIEALSGYTGPHQWTAFINEEGKLKGLPLNSIATVWMHGHGTIPSEDHIVGPCVFMGGVDETGGTMSLTDDVAEAILQWCEVAIEAVHHQAMQARRIINQMRKEKEEES